MNLQQARWWEGGVRSLLFWSGCTLAPIHLVCGVLRGRAGACPRRQATIRIAACLHIAEGHWLGRRWKGLAADMPCQLCRGAGAVGRGGRGCGPHNSPLLNNYTACPAAWASTSLNISLGAVVKGGSVADECRRNSAGPGSCCATLDTHSPAAVFAAGDSRAVLCKCDGTTISLTEDQRADRADEAVRACVQTRAVCMPSFRLICERLGLAGCILGRKAWGLLRCNVISCLCIASALALKARGRHALVQMLVSTRAHT